MLDGLDKIAAQINQVIINDNFPDTIKPAYLRGAVMDYPARGGKRLRPALVMWSCGLLGGKPEDAVYPAAAVEIYHNWTLVHDDIIDNDEVRRGLATTHCEIAGYSREKFLVEGDKSEKFGRDLAILAGDIQQGWAVNMLLKAVEHGVSAPVVLSLSRRLQELVNRELISGEALDVEFPLRGWRSVTADEVIDMLAMKTGALLRFCAEAGGAIALDCADLNRPEIINLGEFACAAGVAFQLRDDWLGVFGDFEKLGKSIGADLTEAKPTILLLKTFEMIGQEEREELNALIGMVEYSRPAIERVRELMRQSGAEKFVLDKSNEFADKARTILKSFPGNKYRKLLLEFIDFLVTREK
ncbi:MAG: polyprenyl synthetase family protein [Victivallaceae bacterium]